MDVEKDFNDILDDIVLSEDAQEKASYNEGYKAGSEAGNAEGFHLGYHRGAQLGSELGHYLGTVKLLLETNETSETKYPDRIINQLLKIEELINAFPQTNSEEHDILKMAETIRAHYKKAYFLQMDTKISKLKQNLDSIISFLTPLLPLANAHMVEFFTESHWDKLLPYNLKCYLEDRDLNDAINEFWDAGYNKNETEITNWVQLARSHCLTVDNDFCLSAQGLEELIKSRGGCMHYQIKVTEFMTSKKSYEVQTMSPYVASWHGMAGTTHCVEAGGGKGNLLVALSLGYQIPSLTVDCDERTLRNGEKRLRIIQKQWHAIAKKINETSEEKVTKNINYDLHKFATAYITKNTDLSEVVCKQFDCDNANLLLTGLHTCGNLGPDSLRIFTSCPAVGALFNVPCCYHLLTEAVDGGLFDGFEREHSSVVDSGFPMSEHLRGFNLGSNARMLAGQSIDRVIAYRQLPIRSLLYRAKLQKIIKNQTPPLSIP
ncbi:unnamed protein product [Leptosia nina]|uniref:Methyltransferase domain-containing protein n=1 Tax=Leptosia nina TaxID=320188 RepID=A0AAV1J1I8_9NEOP